MYSYEINQYLQQNNELTNKEFNNMIKTSSQVSFVKLNRIEEVYSFYNVDTNDGFNWIVKVRNYNK